MPGTVSSTSPRRRSGLSSRSTRSSTPCDALTPAPRRSSALPRTTTSGSSVASAGALTTWPASWARATAGTPNATLDTMRRAARPRPSMRYDTEAGAEWIGRGAPLEDVADKQVELQELVERAADVLCGGVVVAIVGPEARPVEVERDAAVVDAGPDGPRLRHARLDAAVDVEPLLAAAAV